MRWEESLLSLPLHHELLPRAGIVLQHLHIPRDELRDADRPSCEMVVVVGFILLPRNPSLLSICFG